MTGTADLIRDLQSKMDAVRDSAGSMTDWAHARQALAEALMMHAPEIVGLYARGLEDAARRCEHTAALFNDPHCDSAATARALAKTIRALGEKGPTDAHAD